MFKMNKSFFCKKLL